VERVYKDEPSSLLGLIMSDEGKKFYNIDTWWETLTPTLASPALASPGKETDSQLKLDSQLKA
jgi:hypothetical protein